MAEGKLSTIDVDQSEAKESISAQPSALQFIPAKLDFDGKADIEDNFNRFTNRHSDVRENSLQNSFRGRPLDGEHFTVDEGFEVNVLQPTSGDESKLRVIKRLDGFTYWNYDSIPSKSDNMKQAVQWLKIAKALHDEDDDECENKVSN